MIDATSRDVIALVISICVATLLAFVLYRKTTPSLPPWLRLLLGVLRWFAALIILFLVTDPVLRVTETARREPIVAVMIDDSKSMGFPAGGEKLEHAKRIAAGTLAEHLEAKADVRFFTFSDLAGDVSGREVGDLEARGSRTDLVYGMKSVMEAMDTRPSAFVVLSDGGVNFGEDAVHYSSTLRIPVHVMSLAEDRARPDVSIDRIETGGAAYANSTARIWLHLRGSDSGAVETEVTVSDSSGTILTRTVEIPGTGARTRVPVDIETGEIGLHRFRATLAPFAGEEALANNSMAFSLKVIKGKIRVCLVAPRPTWDFAFARRSLEADPNIETSVLFTDPGPPAVRTTGLAGDLVRAAADLDVLAVLRGASLGGKTEDLRQFVRDGCGLLLISAGPSTGVWEEASPLVVSQASRREVLSYSPRVVETGRDHEIMKVGARDGGFDWSGLPPLPVDGSVEGHRDEATVLVTGLSGDRRLPLVTVMRYGLGRVVAFSAFDIWRWDLVPKGFGSETSAFTDLLLNSIGWLAERDEVKRLVLSASKDTYLWGEPADLSARVADENLQIIPGASVEGEIRGVVSGETVRSFAMTDRGAGSHSARVDLLPPSRYTARVTARVDGEVYADETIEFTVDERGLEDLDVDGDQAALEQIAAATGGSAYRPEDSSRLVDDLNPGSTIVRNLRELRLKLTLASFLVLVGLLGVEWLVRKRKMLV